MPERIIPARTHVLVCVLLVLLTVLTVGLSFWHVGPEWHLAFGLAIGFVKASLVALFFMHVIHSPRIVWLVIIIAAAWFLLLMLYTLTDYWTRGLITPLTGH
jgi:cytochrome c oxidase subunit 4